MDKNVKPQVVVMNLEPEEFNTNGTPVTSSNDVMEQLLKVMRDTKPQPFRKLRKELRQDYKYQAIYDNAPMPGDNKIVLFITNASNDDHTFTWFIKGDPLPTAIFTTAQLKQQGIVGVFRPTSEAEQADPKNDGRLYQWVTDMPHPDEYTPESRSYQQPDGTNKVRTLTTLEYQEYASGFVLLPAVLSKMTNPLMVGFYRPNPSKCVGDEEVKPIIIGE